MDGQAWQQKSAEILTNIRAWRQAHPTATFMEIEDEVHRRLMELEAQVLQDAAQTAEAKALIPHEPTDPPASERCVLSVDGAMISLVHQQ